MAEAKNSWLGISQNHCASVEFWSPKRAAASLIRKLDDIDRQKAAAIFARENTAGVDWFTTQAVEAEDAVSLQDGKAAFQESSRPFASRVRVCWPSEFAPQRLHLFC